MLDTLSVECGGCWASGKHEKYLHQGWNAFNSLLDDRGFWRLQYWGVNDPRIHESGFILDHVMHLRINFLKFALTRCSFYIELPKWIASKRHRWSQKYSDQPIKIKVGKFEWSNSGIVVNALFDNKKCIDTACRLELNKKCIKQVNLLMIKSKEESAQAA